MQDDRAGATVQDYDTADNLKWRARGLSLLSTGACDTASVPDAKKASFFYDACNRLKVPPGANAPFTFTITAPSTPGTYSFSWAMLREGYAWFGYTASATINVVAPDPVYDAQLVSANVPSQMAPSGNYNLSLTFKNTGNVTWTQPDYRLANLDDNMTWGLNRVDMSTPSVAPGQSATFNFQVRAPATAGTYPMQWGMVWEYHRRFGQYGSSNVTVSQSAPANGVTYIHTDALGSPVARTDASGRVISRTRYEPYGYVAMGAQPTIGFTGHVNDADTGLTYMQQRYYDPVAGRFLSVDPVVTDANTGSSFNRYTYASNNPYAKVDPDGRSPVDVAFLAVDAAKLVVAVQSGVGVGAAVADVALSALGVAVPIPGAGQALKGITGTYRIAFKTGREYIGKGGVSRLATSMRRLARREGEVVRAEYKAAKSEREALKEESRQIQAAGGARSQNPETNLVNKIDSPGTKMREADGEKIKK